jgi:predicted nucleic acid-binding protein
MTEYLLDTNVPSETTKRRPNQNVVAWLRADPVTHLSVLTIGELRRGAWLQRHRNPEHAKLYVEQLDVLRRQHQGRIHPIDEDVIECWATLPAIRTFPVVDSLIAATALARGLTVATRNIKDFADAGVPTFNPFEPMAE